MLTFLLWVVLILLGIIFLVIISYFGFKFLRFKKYRIKSKNGIDKKLFVMLNEQKQFIRIRGEDRKNPIIIWLHGGPGEPNNFYSYYYAASFLDKYTVVDWDQRGCGRTYFKNRHKDPDNQTASFEQAIQDLDALVDFLCQSYNVEKVILAGTSYGTILGTKYAHEYPDKVSAYVGIGQVVSLESEEYSYRDALEKACEKGDDTTLMEEAYKAYKQNKGLPELMQLRKLTSSYHVVPKSVNILGIVLGSPYLTIRDLRWLLLPSKIEAYIELNKQLFNYTQNVDVPSYGLEYQMPVGIFAGSQDWITPAKISKDFYDSIKAPKKIFCLMKDCGHGPHIEDMVEFSHQFKKMLDEFQVS